MPSIRDVAEKAGVSPATVSRAFTTPGLISLATQQRVFEAARSLEYNHVRSRTQKQPARERVGVEARELTAANLAPGRDAIGFQFFSTTSSPYDTLADNGFYAPLLNGAQSEASTLGLHLLVHTTDRHTLSQEMPRMIEDRVIEGMLLVGTADPDVLSAFSAYVDNIVLVDNHDRTGAFESVVSDGFGGAFTATRHLIDMGHRRLCFLMGDIEAASFQDRLRGFLCAQMESGIIPSPEYIVGGAGGVGNGDSLDAQLAIVAQLLHRPLATRPTALIAANDDKALSVLRLCRDLSVRVPEDFSIIGFDDAPFSAHTEPPLTTVRVDKEYIGRLAVRRLYARMTRQSGKYAPYSQVRQEPVVCSQVGVTLYKRLSCAPPKAGE